MKHEENFTQTISFKCPYCMKNVKIKSHMINGNLTWIEKPRHNEECPFAFTTQRYIPKLYAEKPRARYVAAGHPLIFIVFNSKSGIKENLERAKQLIKEVNDEEKRSLFKKSINRLNNLISTDLDPILEKALNAVKTGFFGLRLYVGYRTFAYLWKWNKKYFGIAYHEEDDHIPFDWITATTSFSEAKEFMYRLLHYYDNL